MEVLPCEEVKPVVGASKHFNHKPLYIQNSEYYDSVISSYYSCSEDSSDEDDNKLAVIEKSSVCCVCGDSIPFLEKLVEHFKTHTDVVHCHLCRTKFGRVMSLALHLKTAHPKHNLLCSVCGSLFSCTWHLNGHIGRHQKDNVEVKPRVEIEETKAICIAETPSCVDLKRAILNDHSYFASTQKVENDTTSNSPKHTDSETDQALHIKTEPETFPLIKDNQKDTSFSSFQSLTKQEHLSCELKQENDNGIEETTTLTVSAEEVITLTVDGETTDTDEDAKSDSLPPGDTAYNPDEDFSSDSDYNESFSLQMTTRQKQQTSDKKTSGNENLKLTKVAKPVEDSSTKLKLSCCLCSAACENDESLSKHMTEKHPETIYICSFCRNAFPRRENFKNHVCSRRPRSNMILPTTSVAQLPVMPAPAIYTNQSAINIINVIPAVNKASTNPPRPVSTLPQTKALTLHQLLQTTPKVTNWLPQVVTIPQTLMRPSFPPSVRVARPKVTIHTPSVVRPLLVNPTRMTLRNPTPSNPPYPTQIVVSISPTVSVSKPTLVSSRQTNVPCIRPVPVNVPQITSVACPTLVSALTRKNQPQVPPPQADAPLQIVGMYMNHSRHLAMQKQFKKSWRSKTIFPCRHCGAVSRQPSMRVRHRYLHRGSRLYRCQCGRSFQRQLHLLRHQVQHAESVRFLCTWCGHAFKGAHKFTSHKRKRINGRRRMMKKCKVVFDCSCGQIFARPSALLWHMLKNTKLSLNSKRHKV